MTFRVKDGKIRFDVSDFGYQSLVKQIILQNEWSFVVANEMDKRTTLPDFEIYENDW